ncbi:MAG: SAM-dependent methyltransferase [Erysipelotrichales bacterium]|nr:SAM-dependent methyltransferase [Erysipelotrichales bacterium]
MIETNGCVRAILSNPRKKAPFIRMEIKKIRFKTEFLLNIASYTRTQVFHQNIKEESLQEFIEKEFVHFKQLDLWTDSRHFIYLSSKNHTITRRVKMPETKVSVTEHNRVKQYLLPEGTIIPPLIDLGIFDKDLKVVKKHYAKYKQINRFLEFIEEVIKEEQNLNIVDFGCGSSYLTFIVYYYLTEIKKVKVKMTGLDLKADVIDKCIKIKEKYNYKDLDFRCQDIKDFQTEEKVDMLISLHACDIATDYCLYNAIKLNIRYILAVPCCHKEVNKQISGNELAAIMRHGLVKDRFASLLTDTIRERILRYYGYQTNMLEFVSYEDTPKNLLIRAVKNGQTQPKALEEIRELVEKFKINPKLLVLFGIA